MEHTYEITGMTCNGCRTDVENRLNTIKAVKTVNVSLENEEAVVEMNASIAIEDLKKVLPDKYTVREKKNVFGNTAYAKTEPKKTKIEQLKPLFLIIGYIAIATILLNYNRENWDAAMLDFMGLFFIVFSFFKFLDLKGFQTSFAMYDPLAKAIPVYGWIYPFIETALGLLFLMRFEVNIALIVTLVILGITTIGVTKILLDKKSIQCACLGTALKLPMTEATFIENAIMIIMAVFMLIS